MNQHSLISELCHCLKLDRVISATTTGLAYDDQNICFTLFRPFVSFAIVLFLAAVLASTLVSAPVL